MPWSYDGGHPDPLQRFQWTDDGTPPEPARPAWPDDPRRAAGADPAGETAQVAAEFTAALAALVRHTLDELDRLGREDP